MSTNEKRLRDIIVDVLILDEGQYGDGLGPFEVPTWDSLAMVEISAAISREFECELPPEETVVVESVADIKDILRTKGFDFP